jgi:hypothetical protein
VTVDEYDKVRKPQGETDAVAPQRGPAPSLIRSEVASLAIFAQWACFESERALYRDATRHVRAAFAGWPARSQFTRLVRQAQDRLVAVGQWLAGHLASGGCAYEVLGSTALVTRNAKRRGDGGLVGQADMGRSNRGGWYEGLHCSSPLASSPRPGAASWCVLMRGGRRQAALGATAPCM